MTDYVHRISDEERERIRRFVHGAEVVTLAFVAIVGDFDMLSSRVANGTRYSCRL